MPGDQWPKFLRERPSVMVGLEIFYEAFHELSSCRQIGLGIGPLPFTAIVDYCDRFEMDEAQTIEILRRMDDLFLEHCRESVKAGR